MEILKMIRNDPEIQQLKKEWKEKFKETFPLWNYDEFGGIDDYKKQIKNALELGDYQKVFGNSKSKFDKYFEQLERIGVCSGIGKDEFLEKAKEMGYTQEQIDLIVKDMEEDIALGLPVDWEMELIELPYND